MEALTTPFKLSFKAMNLYGFYLPDNCKLRWKFYGFLMFCFINVQFVLASIYPLFLLESIDDFILSMIYVIFSTSLTFKVISFKWNEGVILEIMKEFEELERMTDSNAVVKLHSDIREFVKKSFITDGIVGFMLSLTVLVFGKGKGFVIPVLFETQNDWLYYALFALQYVQVYGIGSSSVAVESIFTICLMMMQAQIDSMKKVIGEMGEIKDETMKKIIEYQVQLKR
jgi:7tm Odorant receptor